MAAPRKGKPRRSTLLGEEASGGSAYTGILKVATVGAICAAIGAFITSWSKKEETQHQSS
jgi:hypothetical protein